MNPRRRRHNRLARKWRLSCEAIGVDPHVWRQTSPKDRMVHLIDWMFSGVRGANSPMLRAAKPVEERAMPDASRGFGWQVGETFVPFGGET